jgi:isopentenyl-diphosphate delta-isomerase
MASDKNQTSLRKINHIDICLNKEVDYSKSNGFEKYEFEHNAITEVIYSDIDISTHFYNYKVDFPFIISCMTGGTKKAGRINSDLATAASELNIPVGVGSQRETLESSEHKSSYETIKTNASNVPKLSNIGAAQVAQLNNIDPILMIIEQIEASVLVIHVNPLQELIQKEGEPHFAGFMNKLEMICKKINTPVIVKEVGSGISKNVAEKLLDVGVRGIDVAGAGGTSWSAVEMLRENDNIDNYFWNWGLPTSYCVRTVAELKKDRDFLLISSGGITTADDIAKSIALGADMAASAKMLLKEHANNGTEGIINLIKNLFESVKKIMYLTGSTNLEQLKGIKLIKKEDLF